MSNKKAIPIFDPSLQIGLVESTTLADVNILINSTATIDDQCIAPGVGDYVIISYEQRGLYCRIIALSANSAGKIARAEFMLSLAIDNGKLNLSPGITTYPQANAQVYLAHPTIVKYIANSDVGSAGANNSVQLKLAQLYKNGEAEIGFTPERIFGRHCAVLGTSGSGKSWSLAKLIEESSRYNSKLILFDATGEFYTLRRGVRHVYLGEDSTPRSGSIQVAIPHHQLKDQDLFAIFQPGGESQPSKLRAAIKTLKLLQLAPEIGYNGLFIKAHKEKLNFDRAYKRFFSTIENPYPSIDIGKLTQQIENECIFPNRSVNEAQFWGGPNSHEQGDCVALINRIDDIIRSPHLACIFSEQGLPSLFDEINSFLSDSNSRVLRISLQFLPFAYSAREIIANALARHLLEQARAARFKNSPLVILLDEAHQFLSEAVINHGGGISLDSFSLIAKEGRKYGLTLCIATQRPRDIPEGVLSQIGTMLVHRLINHHDRSVVERASGELSSSTLSMLPNLAAGEAIVMGVDYPLPLIVQMQTPENKPDSSGPNYQLHWKI